ncbi:MAG TPA: glycosyltransferase family 4 protein [Candidatus Limnocylindrales bacterium]|nr:glycosyltransferase family 4 protein [Candidatus Limnocylindrales bacterium]
MKIAQIAPLIERVPPKTYGGTERVVSALTEELVKRGHDVTLFASGDSITTARLFPIYPTHLRQAKLDDFKINSIRLMGIGIPYQRQEEFDIIHDHNLPFSTPTANLAQTPVVATLHGPIDPGNQELYENLNNPYLISISEAQVPKNAAINHITTIYHGFDMRNYPFSDTHKDYLLYVGRIAPKKGLHHAIGVAQKLNKRLIIAAKLDELHRPYFEEKIKPYLNDQISWIGEVNELERNKLMANTLAFLHPACWEEPFGLTMIEAMACGAPVVAFNRGSIPELIKNGRNGYVVETPDEMVDAISHIANINRRVCRRYALQNFNVEKMTDQYELVYQTILKGRDKSIRKISKTDIFSPALSLPRKNT